jgi:hypothetical protein
VVPNTADATTRWWHSIDQPIPSQFSQKFLAGTQKQLAEWICPVFALKSDPRNLHGLARYGLLWIVGAVGRHYWLVYFRSAEKFAEANARYLRFQQEQQK